LFDNVLHIGPQYKNHRGGIGAVIATYALNIDHFKFIATHDGKLNAIGNCIFFVWALFKIIFKLLFDNDIKIVHIHGASKGSFYRKYLVFLIAKFIFRKKIVYHLHGAEFHLFYEKTNSFTKKLIKHLGGKVDVFICLSQRWFSYLSGAFHIQRLCIVNNPVDMPALLNQGQDNNKSQLKMLFLGRIGERKGVFDLLTVLASLNAICNNRVKLFVGGDGDIKRLQSFIKSNKLGEVVEFVGWVNGQQKQGLLAQCDVLVLPSYNEGLPICILEAMSYGKAIIATTVGGIPEVVINGENGYLIEPGDIDALDKSIWIMINNPKIVKQMGENSMYKIEPFMIKNVMKQLATIYDKLLA